jgi:hypothetical protein
MATEYANGKIVTNGLILSLDAADRNSYPGTGTTWTDLSGNGNNGTLTNGPTFNSANGGSIVLDGINDYIDIGLSAIVNQSLPFTVSLWFMLTSMPSGTTTPFTFKTNTGANFIILIGSDASYRGTVVIGPDANIIGKTDTDSSFFLNKWVNLSVTYNGSGHTVVSNYIAYENAVQKTLNSGVGGVFDPRQNTILGYVNSNNTLIGRIAIVYVYSSLLSSTQVLQNYNAQKSRFGL